MYEYVPRPRIVEILRHVRNLLQQAEPRNQRQSLTAERREIVAKYILSNLSRTGPHPTLATVREIVDTFLLTIGAAHRLFGYDLDALQQYDLLWNAGRTHIVESYIFNRDKRFDFPLELAPERAFRTDALLSDLVREWQPRIPIRAFDRASSNTPGAFYVHVGTEDSRGLSLPPGSMALVDPIDFAEGTRPNPRHIYLLQFRNGYRCSRCVVTAGRLHILTSKGVYVRAREFRFPGEVRIAGRIRMFAHALPQPKYELHANFPTRRRPADLILPWEHLTRDRLLLTEFRRFFRTEEEESAFRLLLEDLFHSSLTKRTERRYRHSASSEPHVSALLQLTLLHFAQYSNVFNAGGLPFRERGRYSLETMVNARTIQDLSPSGISLRLPEPESAWNACKAEFISWLPLLSVKFPKLNIREEPVLRLSGSQELPGLEPGIAAGSWMLLKQLEAPPDTSKECQENGWSRPLYVLRRGLHFVTGYLEQDGADFALLSGSGHIPRKEHFGLHEISSLLRVAGVAVPV